MTEPTGEPIRGTSLVITGFRGAKDWRRRIGTSVIGNYFHAIATGGLTVLIEPEETTDQELFEIDGDSLEAWFDDLDRKTAKVGPAGERDADVLAQARTFWEMTTQEDATAEKQDSDLGHCRLWVRVAEGLPSKVGFVRRTGMLVTTRQPGLLRFSGFQDFAALCVFEDPTGNELLRRMENPRHDQFEPARLPEHEQERGRRALARITRWIRETIREQATSPAEGRETVISELATYLPDLNPDEPFDDAEASANDTNEPGFGTEVTVDLRPVRRRHTPTLSYQDDDGDGTGNGEGETGGSGSGRNHGDGGGGGAGDGDGDGGSGSTGGNRGRRPIPISCVRILADQSTANRYQLSFRAHASGVARLALEEAGDSSAVPRDDIRLVGDDLSLDRVRLVTGQRVVLQITADAPIADRAWRLTAVTVDGEGK
ncbi:MAG: hypothetical protein F4Y74_07720 [Gemmatimonadales bacterium]|nr:hypothetical protein [Gemmatimonadales bacterium]